MTNKNKLNHESWVGYLSTIVAEVFGTFYVDGIRMDEGSRTYYRWTKEGKTPDFFQADRWLCRYDLFIQDYINFCQINEIPVWHDSEPDWVRDVAEEGAPKIV